MKIVVYDRAMRTIALLLALVLTLPAQTVIIGFRQPASKNVDVIEEINLATGAVTVNRAGVLSTPLPVTIPPDGTPFTYSLNFTPAPGTKITANLLSFKGQDRIVFVIPRSTEPNRRLITFPALPDGPHVDAQDASKVNVFQIVYEVE